VANYSLKIKPSAAKEFEALPKKDRQRVAARIQALATEPRPPGCEKLSGQDTFYRVRQGNYRILFTADDAALLVVVYKIGHRREVYR
jgi:mRNA interferase RelE/StbE